MTQLAIDLDEETLERLREKSRRSGLSLVAWAENAVHDQLHVKPQGLRLRDLPELLASLPHLAPGDVAAFESDLDEIRRDLGPRPLPDPWES